MCAKPQIAPPCGAIFLSLHFLSGFSSQKNLEGCVSASTVGWSRSPKPLFWHLSTAFLRSKMLRQNLFHPKIQTRISALSSCKIKGLDPKTGVKNKPQNRLKTLSLTWGLLSLICSPNKPKQSSPDFTLVFVSIYTAQIYTCKPLLL